MRHLAAAGWPDQQARRGEWGAHFLALNNTYEVAFCERFAWCEVKSIRSPVEFLTSTWDCNRRIASRTTRDRLAFEFPAFRNTDAA